MSHDWEGVQSLVSQTLILPSDREREAELYVALCAEHCHQLHALSPRQQHANATFKWKENAHLVSIKDIYWHSVADMELQVESGSNSLPQSLPHFFLHEL